MHTILYAHDLDGSPADPLPRLLKGSATTVLAPDGRFRPLAARAADLRAALAAHPGATLVGSGYGALAALAVAVERPADVHHLVLVGPALGWSEPGFDPATLELPPSLPVTLFHAADDGVTPVTTARRFAARWPSVRLVVLPDVHDLRGSLPDVAAAIRTLARAPAPRTPDDRADDPSAARNEQEAAARKERARREAARTRARAAAERAATKAKEAKRRAREEAAAALRAAKAWGDRTRAWGSRDPSVPMPEPPLPPPHRGPARPSTRGYAPRTSLVFAHDPGAFLGDGPAPWLPRGKVVVLDGRGRAFEDRVRELVAAADARPGCVVGGSGDGARVALAVAAERSVAGLLLLGPTLGPDDVLARSVPMVIVHGAHDAGLETSRALVARHSRARLLVVERDVRDAGLSVVAAWSALQAAIRR